MFAFNHSTSCFSFHPGKRVLYKGSRFKQALLEENAVLSTFNHFRKKTPSRVFAGSSIRLCRRLETYLEPSQTSTMELLCENNQRLKVFDWVLNTPLGDDT